MLRKNILAALIVLLAFLLSPCSANYIEFKTTDLDTIHKQVEEYIRQRKWEEAAVTFNYLMDLIRNYNQYDKFPDLKLLERQIDELMARNLDRLFDQGQYKLKNAEFDEALKIFRKILYYNYQYPNARKSAEQARILRNLSTFNNYTHQMLVVVTSKTLDKNITGLRIYKPEKCYNGYTLFTHRTLNEALPVQCIYLIDMEGNIVYKWVVENDDIVFGRLEPNGNLLYIDNDGLKELDYQSHLVWYYKGNIDHDFQTLTNGNILIERNEFCKIEKPLEFQQFIGIYPRIDIITRNKKILWEWKSENHIDELEKLTGLKIVPIGDWAHINTCEQLNDNAMAKKDSRFRKGNILFSYPNLNVIGIINYQTKKIVWAWGPGIIHYQHAPTMLKNGNILIFDNGNCGWSRIIELNPVTEKIVWEYHSKPKKDFYSSGQSNVQQLPNGNRLICETDSNRIFEITPQGEIVWDFISTFRKMTGSYGIYRAYRYSPEYVKPLLDKIKKWQTEQANSLTK